MRALKTFTPDDNHFNPQQPRDWHGRWTAVGGGASAEDDSAPSADVGQVFSIFADRDSVPLSQRIAQLSGRDDDSDPAAPLPAGATVTYSNAVTGDERIDRTTERLTSTLRSVMDVFDFIPTLTPGVYGTAVHSAFGAAVRLQNLEVLKLDTVSRTRTERITATKEAFGLMLLSEPKPEN